MTWHQNPSVASQLHMCFQSMLGQSSCRGHLVLGYVQLTAGILEHLLLVDTSCRSHNCTKEAMMPITAAISPARNAPEAMKSGAKNTRDNREETSHRIMMTLWLCHSCAVNGRSGRKTSCPAATEELIGIPSATDAGRSWLLDCRAKQVLIASPGCMLVGMVTTNAAGNKLSVPVSHVSRCQTSK